MSEQRDHILTCACELFLKDGLDGFSMRKLARRVGVTAPALYRHYESKEKVLHAVVSEAYERMAHALYHALEGATPLERLMLAGQGYLDFALGHPRLYDALFASPELVGLGDLPPGVEAQGCAIGQFWNDRVRECMDAGILREGDPRDVSVTMWAHAHGLLSLYGRGLLAFGGTLDEGGFRVLYRASERRVLEGMTNGPLPESGTAGGERGAVGSGADQEERLTGARGAS
jgi:AcrR family transcriptional regulator